MTPTALCEDRFPLTGSPSTCVLDTVIVPLPSFIFTIALIIGLILRSRSRSRFEPTKPILPRWLHILYFTLIVATVAMRVLEIARLIAAKQGVGLLPMDLACLSIVGGIIWRKSRSATLSAGLIIYWFFMAVVEAVKVNRLVLLNNIHPAKGTKYPSSDWLLDNAVILGLYLTFIVIEAIHLLLYRRHPLQEQEMMKLGVV